MAQLTPGSDKLVIRLVYDGPPQSGKTTSLRALAGSLAQPHLSLEEAEGRTLYFDWVEYVGGSFEGLPIHCQILSVPGQPALARRRQALLASADAVIFVADTAGPGVRETIEALRSLRDFLSTQPEPRPGLVVQANKRDQPGALPIDTLRARLDGNGMAFIESVATEGVGIREAFVLAVRLALDRVRELLASGLSARHSAHTETPEELLASIKAADASAPLPMPGALAAALGPEPPAAAILREVLAKEEAFQVTRSSQPPSGTRSRRPETREPELDATHPPRLPDSDAPSGRVWPPVAGRMLLHEVPVHSAQLRQGPDGSWRTSIESWGFHSAAEHHFRELDDGKRELLRWARLHSGAAFDRLTSRRCIVLTDTGIGGWRLWQLVHVQRSLRQQLWVALVDADPAGLAETLLACAADLLQARDLVAGDPPLPCRLELLGRVRSSLMYVGILPPPSWVPSAGEIEADASKLLRRELLPVLQKGLATARIDIPRVLQALSEGRQSAEHPQLREMLSALLIEP